jgi:putative membrane protein
MPADLLPEPGKGPGYTPFSPDFSQGLDQSTRMSLERTGLAHERTLMGWVRTCFSMIGFGFTIFTFWTTLLSKHQIREARVDPKYLCIMLTLGGSVFMALATAQSYRAFRRLFKAGLEREFSLATLAAALVFSTGVLGTLIILANP